jgi:tetratricopeptide (TPR) repeat protein
MRRFVWLLGLLAIAAGGTVWWASRNAIRMEPLDAQRFAQMRETEQVEWLIEQILVRSKRTDTLTMLREKIPFLQSVQVSRPLTATDVDVIAAACIEYNLMHWLQLCKPYVEFESDRERLRMYQAVLQARRGNWHAAERAVERISTRPIRALALAHLGRLRAEAGQAEAAQHYFEQAYTLLSQLTDWTYVFDTFTALSLLTQLSHFGDNPDQLMQIVQRIPTNFQEEAVRRVAAVYRQRGDVEQLSRLVALAPRGTRVVARAKLAHALIDQGHVDEGLKTLVRTKYCPAEQIVPIIYSIYQKGHRDEAQMLAQQLHRTLERDLRRSLPSWRQSSDAWLETPYGWVVVPADFTKQRLVLTLLVSMYAAWGQDARAEQLMSASPDDASSWHSLHIRYCLALAYHKIGKQNQARKQLEQVSVELQRLPPPARDLAIAEVAATDEMGDAYVVTGNYRLLFEIAERRLAPTAQRDGLVAILRGFVYRRQPLWRQLLETQP